MVVKASGSPWSLPSLLTYPCSLKSRPCGVNCGPNAPMWQVAHGCPVWTAKDGTAMAGSAPCMAAKKTVAKPAQMALACKAGTALDPLLVDGKDATQTIQT